MSRAEKNSLNKKILICFSSEDRDTIYKLANEAEIPVSNFIRKIVRDHLKSLNN